MARSLFKFALIDFSRAGDKFTDAIWKIIFELAFIDVTSFSDQLTHARSLFVGVTLTFIHINSVVRLDAAKKDVWILFNDFSLTFYGAFRHFQPVSKVHIFGSF